LHLALILSGLNNDPFSPNFTKKYIVTQAFTYIATANVIVHAGYIPIFCDVDENTMGMCPKSLLELIKKVGKDKIVGCIPMNTLGVKCNMPEIRKICAENGIKLIVDSCQSIMTDNFFEGDLTCLSFNGNKPISTGGGGGVLTNDPDVEFNARKYLNQIGPIDRVWYNYRMPNINAAIGCGMLEDFELIKEEKIETATKYKAFAAKQSLKCPTPLSPWVNALIVSEPEYVKDYLSNNMIESRLGFPLLTDIEMYKNCISTEVPNSEYLSKHIIMLPSGVSGVK
jgi:dTDP-4-amino-4,6-dideoxygalactose transaminase